MRILPIAAAAAFCLGAWLEAPAQAQEATANAPRAQQSIDARLKSLEKKTDHYEIKKFKRTKTFARPQNAGRAGDFAPPGCNGDSPPNSADRFVRCTVTTEFDKQYHVIAMIWVEWTATVKTSRPFRYMLNIGGAGTENCLDEREFGPPSGGQKQLAGKLLCRILVNAGKTASTTLNFGTDGNIHPPPGPADYVVESVTFNISVIAEVLTEFQ
jgi:hypothetical protein